MFSTALSKLPTVNVAIGSSRKIPKSQFGRMEGSNANRNSLSETVSKTQNPDTELTPSLNSKTTASLRHWLRRVTSLSLDESVFIRGTLTGVAHWWRGQATADRSSSSVACVALLLWTAGASTL